MFKRHSILMLSTEKATDIYKVESIDRYTGREKGNSLNIVSKGFNKPKDNIGINLYILSDEEIKLNDYYYSGLRSSEYSIHKADSERLVELCNQNEGIIKVITTTDKSLNLPQPSESFIKVFIEAYNQGNPITEVMVEYKEKYVINPNFADEEESEYILKVDKNNIITIRKIKDSFTRDEVLKILADYAYDFRTIGYGGHSTAVNAAKQWFNDKNL